MSTYTVTVTREDGLWAAVVGGLPAGVVGGTDERRLAELFVSVPDLVAGLVDSTDFSLDWHIIAGDREVTKPILNAWRRADDLAHAKEAIADARHEAVEELKAAGLSYREIADALQISHQRVSQLVTS